MIDFAMLPKALTVNGQSFEIDSDYRTALNVLIAYNDADLSNDEKIEVLLRCIYNDFSKITENNLQEALEKAVLFLDCKTEPPQEVERKDSKKVLDWKQDEQIIFSAVNKVFGQEIRELPYMHWWTFLGYFNEIGEGLLSTVITIREKKNAGKKLEKYEQDFYREHKTMIKLKTQYSAEEQAERDYVNKLLEGEVK